MAAFIEIDNISKTFDGGRSFAVREVSLLIEAGAFLAFIGASGSGKTTTLKSINRLVEPDSGEVRIAGDPVGAEQPSELRRRIGYVCLGRGRVRHNSLRVNI